MMSTTTPNQRVSPVLRVILYSFIPLLFLQSIDLLTVGPFIWSDLLVRWAFILAVLLLSRVYRWGYRKHGRVLTSIAGIVIVFLIILSATTDNTALAWIAIIFLYVLLIWADTVLATGHNWFQRLAIHAIITFWAGFIPVALTQIASQFAEEELYAGVITLVLMLLWIVTAWVSQRLDAPTPHSQPGIKYNFAAILIVLMSLSLAGLLATVHTYQKSFFPAEAPVYEGITSQSPFICGQITPDSTTYQGQQITKNLLKLVEQNPNKQSPEYAYLALGTRDSQWIEKFKVSILDEAQAGSFTQPENSVKSSQYDASRRVYFYTLMIAAWPDLFTPQENELLQNWFAAINRRAQTVGWVDWLYALAFSQWPDGPYENQEIGAGLLALLETSGLSDPSLREQNQQYLAENPRGWNQRFRNTDDAYIYQAAWLANALFQSQYFGNLPAANANLSFEWLKLQALPDGAPLGYNHPFPLSPASSAYLGAELTGRDGLLWLAGRSTEYLLAHSGVLAAYPTLLTQVEVDGHSPEEGTCLLYGDSGLPNQVGSLAPDKIVFRNGWSPGSWYMLLNLRFTGWHRYKATNTISLIYQAQPLIQDQTRGETPSWLPAGRSLFRDKRIPRENLNGFTIEKTGLNKVVYTLTSLGSIWAQDPPYYAEVIHFDTGPAVDTSRTLIRNWHGWQHLRTVMFYHDGPVVIVDTGEGPKKLPAAVFWHLAEYQAISGNRITIRNGDQPVEMVLIPLDNEVTRSALAYQPQDSGGMAVKYEPSSDGHLSLVTIILTDSWVGADARVTPSASGLTLMLMKDSRQLNIPLNVELPIPNG